MGMSFSCYAWTDPIEHYLDTLKEHRKSYDFIVCQGLSGQSAAFVASYVLNIPLLILRKSAEEEPSKKALRGESLLEGWELLYRWKNERKKVPRVCFIDDCVSNGYTRRRCGAAVHKAGGAVTCQVVGGVFTEFAETSSVVAGFKTGKVTMPKPRSRLA